MDRIFEMEHDKTNKMTYVPIEDSNQPGHDRIFEVEHDKTNKMTYVPSEDSDQPGHLPRLIRGFAVHLKKVWVLTET